MVELSVLSSWKEMVKGQIEERISKLKQNFKQPTGNVLQNADVKACLSDLDNKNVFVPADKAPNNIIIICKRYYIETLIKELGLDNSSTTTGNSTYTPCQMSSEDIVNTHYTFMKSFGIELSDDDKRLPYLYWTNKLQKSPVKHRFIAGSSKFTTKQLSSLLTKILTVIKTGLEKYYSIKTSHTGVNNMWILKNSTNLLSSLGHLGVHKATSIQTFDFSTLYTSIKHYLLKSRMNNIINNAFKHKNGATRCTHIKVGRNKSHFTSDPLNGDNKYTANDICKMIEFLVDNICVRFGRQLFQQMVGIPRGTNCEPLLADLFLYFYENEFLDKLIKEGLLEGSIYHIIILTTLSLLIIKDLRSSFLIFTPKNSQFLKPQNLLQLLLISICFSHEIEATILQPNYMTNVMHLASTLLTFPSCQAIFHQHQPMVSMHLSSFAMPVVAQIILIF